MTPEKGAVWAFVGALFAAFAAQGFIYGRADLASFLEDDAFYYIVIARNLAEQGVSTFDGVSPTNGYHPLWLALVAMLRAIGLRGLPAIHILQIVMNAGSLILIYRMIRPRDALSILFVAAAFLMAMFDLGTRGMEVDFLILTFCLFLHLLTGGPPDGRARNFAIGVAGALCIGARIDAAVFVLPLLFVGDAPSRDKAWRLLAPAVGGAAYVALNLGLVGLPLPVSGYVKSLGGLHLNTALVEQVRASIPPAAGPLEFIPALLRASINDRLFWFVWILLATSYAAIVTRGATRRILALFAAGLIVFLLKLFFLSSWQIWRWYNFPITMGLICLLLVLRDKPLPSSLALCRRRWPIFGVFALAAYVSAATALAIATDAMVSPGAGAGFYAINKRAAAEWRDLLGGARVAMGDRAGSFSYLYGGDVVQLEGLTGDRDYLDALKTGGDIAPLLCARGVRFVLAYRRDLGRYREVEIPVIRPLLSDYRNSPVLRMKAEDEIGRIQDLALFDPRPPSDDAESFLYGWRLSACSGKLER